MKKLPETISEEEVRTLIKGVKRRHHALSYALGFYQCMRVSEVVKLRLMDVDKPRRLIHIKQAKGGKDRNIPIAPEVMRALKYLPIKCGVRALQIAFKNHAKKILDKELHFHSLRHSGATYYLNVQKWNTRQVQMFLGHSNLQTTQIYTHVTPKDLIEQMWGKE